jgi:hypothetical protein
MKIDTRPIVNREQSVKVLNRLLAVLNYSLARYLSFARPWVRRPYLLLEAIARRMSYEHESFARKLARLIHDRRGAVERGVFPMDFTSYNDLSLEFLAPKLLKQQRALILCAEESAKYLDADPEARRLVNGIVQSLRRYAELLEELLAPHRVAPGPADEVRSAEVRPRPAFAKDRERLKPYAAAPQTAV